MKRIITLVLAAAAALLLVSCPMPSGLTGPAVDAGDGGQVAPPTAAATVENDAARGLAVFVDEKGARVDIEAMEPDGSVVQCVEAYGLTALSEQPAAKHFVPGVAEAKCIVFGRRPDGWPGAWVVLGDNTVVPAFTEPDGAETTRFPDCGDRDGGIRAGRGWRYYITGWASDGQVLLVAGYAKNERGFPYGRWAVAPNTTVGVYWKLLKRGRHPWYAISRARVIGTPDPERQPPRGWHRRHPSPWMWGILSRLKLFLLDYFSAYLTMTDRDGTAWDQVKTMFTVQGTDQDGQEAVATISRDDVIAITPVAAADKPDLVVTAVQVPGAAVQVGEQFSPAAVVTNSGAVEAAAFRVSFYLSADAVDGSDTLIGTGDAGALAAGAAATVSCAAACAIPAPGTHYVFAVADSSAAVDEEDEDNNSASAAVPVVYPRVVIDTYVPVEGGFGGTDTWLSLYGSTGDPTLESGPSLWTADAGAMAEDNDGNSIFFPFARIDYTAGLAPGTYYVRVRGAESTELGSYAIRVLTASNPDAYPASAYFPTTNRAERSPAGAAYEPDDHPVSGAVPEDPVTLGIVTPINRYLEAGDIDWFRLVLP